MINFSLPILPGVACAGISIGRNISDYLAELYTLLFHVETVHYKTLPTSVVGYSINTGLLKINILETGEIISLSCLVGYQGRCKGIFYPSMSVAEVLAASSKTNLLHGALIIDEDYGFYFPLPSPYDELADSIAHVPEDVGLNGLHVENIHWWFKPTLTPTYAKPPAN